MLFIDYYMTDILVDFFKSRETNVSGSLVSHL